VGTSRLGLSAERRINQEFCNTRKRLLNKEKRRFLTLTRAKEFGGTTAFHITRLREGQVQFSTVFGLSPSLQRSGWPIPLLELHYIVMQIGPLTFLHLALDARLRGVGLVYRALVDSGDIDSFVRERIDEKRQRFRRLPRSRFRRRRANPDRLVALPRPAPTQIGIRYP
jgi:hypothetical protein